MNATVAAAAPTFIPTAASTAATSGFTSAPSAVVAVSASASTAALACAGCLIERRDEFQLAQHVLYMKGFMFLSTGFLGLVFYGGSDMYCAAAASPETLLACLHDVSPGRRASYAAECVLYSLQADDTNHRAATTAVCPRSACLLPARSYSTVGGWGAVETSTCGHETLDETSRVRAPSLPETLLF